MRAFSSARVWSRAARFTADALLAAFVLYAAAAVAQPGAATGGSAAVPNGCGSAQLQPRLSPDPQLQGKGGEDLSNRLAQSGGVICPPTGVDPAMKAPTPSTGDKPVIPAPGSPGGDQSIQPK